MINPVLVDKINEVEKGRRERQVAEIQLISKAYPEKHGIPNPLKIARMLISRLGLYRAGAEATTNGKRRVRTG